jgi:very-short-patch-repair endonuclease
MSDAKRTLHRVVRAWITKQGPSPQLLRQCETCSEKAWQTLDAAIVRAQIDARLPNGARADLLLTDADGGVRLVVQLDGGSRLPNRVDARSGLPVTVVRRASLANDPLQWVTVRENNLPGFRCRCAGARSLNVDDDFSLRAIGCPIHLRHDGTQHFARVIEDCGRCAFFVGIGYTGLDRRRIQLKCGFGVPHPDRRPSVSIPASDLLPRLQIVARS